MPKCQIGWVDQTGETTHDENDSVGVVFLKAYSTVIQGHTIQYPDSERFHICAAHLERLGEPGMEKWHYEPYPDGQAPAPVIITGMMPFAAVVDIATRRVLSITVDASPTRIHTPLTGDREFVSAFEVFEDADVEWPPVDVEHGR